MQIAVAGVKHIGDVEFVLLGKLGDALENLRQAAARDLI